MIYEVKTGHTGGSLSCTDILTVLYYSVMKINPSNPGWEERDRFILSKGHSVESYYCILADKGFFLKEDLEDLKTFSKFGSKLIGHPNNEIPGIEMNTGSLGHGLPIAVGMALAAKMDGKSWRVFVLMGDGEQTEGSVWEGAMAVAHYRLDNLIAIIDRNKLQMSGNTEDVMRMEPLEEKWKSFGWEVIEVYGNDVEQLEKALKSVPVVKNKPTVLMAYTIKGKGISFIENDVGLPIPSTTKRIDITLASGVPAFLQTLEVILNESFVERAIVAEEILNYSPHIYKGIQKPVASYKNLNES